MRCARRVEYVRLAIVVSAVLAVVACGDRQDAPMPPSLRPTVDAARASLATNQDGLDSTFVFRLMRCREDAGVLLLFDQVGPFGSEGTAIALSAGPPSGQSSWAGGFAPIDPATNLEIRAFFEAGREVPCDVPPAP